jgi:hypothetical protein
MTEAAESLDLSGVLAMQERWRRVAWSTQDDPDAHHKMLETADRLNSGEDVPTVPWEQVKTFAGVPLVRGTGDTARGSAMGRRVL